MSFQTSIGSAGTFLLDPASRVVLAPNTTVALAPGTAVALAAPVALAAGATVAVAGPVALDGPVALAGGTTVAAVVTGAVEATPAPLLATVPGWTPAQVAAANQLPALVQAYQALNTAMEITEDFSAEGAAALVLLTNQITTQLTAVKG